MPGSMRRFSGTLEHPPPRRDTMDRRHSNASDTSLPDTNHVRQLSQENIPTRVNKVTAPRPAANPLQFIKVGPATLYKSAQEQLKKAEAIKKVTKEVRDEAEDWQSNLDNWKSSRRKRQEHIIERVVEVKKFELEEYDRNRRRSKTFNEMMEDRNIRGRKSSLVLFKDDDANDLSDLGIGTSSGKSSISEDYGNDNHQNSVLEETNSLHSNQNGKQRNNGHHDDDASSLATVSSPEPEEYTYERAIQSYVNFTETRVKSRTPTTRSNLNNSREGLDDSRTSSTEKLSNGHQGTGLPSPPRTPRRQSGAKIEEKLSALENRRRSSTELKKNNANNDKRMPIAKGDVLKRRELFERACEFNEQFSKPPRRLSEDVTSTKGNHERLSQSSKQNEKTSNTNSNEGSPESVKRLSDEVKERITGKEVKHRLSNGNINSTESVQERLSHNQKHGEQNDYSSVNNMSELSNSINERLSNLDSSSSRNKNRKFSPNRHSTEKPDKILNGIDNMNKSMKVSQTGSERSSSPEDDVIYETKKQFHRSLDSLDAEGSSDICNETFERVQSLEDLDCCNHARNYPASASSTEMLVFSSQSGDTDREDSGIHTADVSCSVSQADEPVDDGEIIATINSVVPHLETSSNGIDVYHLEVEIVNQKHVGGRTTDQQSPVPAQSHHLITESKDIATANVDVKRSSIPMMKQVDVHQMPNSRNNAVSPQHDSNSSSSLMVVMEEQENLPEIQNPECSKHVDNSSPLCSSPVMEISLDKNAASDECSVESTELFVDNINNTFINVAQLTESSFDPKDNACLPGDNITPCPQDTLANNMPVSSEISLVVVETDNNESFFPVLTSEVTEQFPITLPAGTVLSASVACMQNKDPHSSGEKPSTPDRRKTVVEVCEKINVNGDGACQSLKSPLPTPFITVSDIKVNPFKEPEKVEKETMLPKIASEEQNVYNGNCELQNDVQQKSNDSSIISENLKNTEEHVIPLDINSVQQLTPKENSVQKVTPNIKEEQKLESTVVNKPENQVEDEVFLPVTTSQIPPLNLSSDVEIVAGLAFPLGPPTSAEPPKEKPPPPPTELSDEEVPAVTNLKRLDSTKRIKKEIRRKRSDFLGIEGGNDDSFLEPELKVAPPPDMTTFLVEERRSEQQLYRQSICSETDSIHGETTESRDSGVELDRAHSDDWPGKMSSTPEVLSAEHSRQNSDIYGTASITSEEEEIMKKEREIIEILEKEEQWRYRNNTTQEENDLGEKLAVKLHQLEQEKRRLEWERQEEENKRQINENACREEELRLKAKEQELRQQESLVASSTKRPSVTGKEERITSASGEALQAERERLQRENEKLQRQKETLQLRESQQLRQNQMHQQWGSTTILPHQQWDNENTGLPPTHLSLQDISMAPTGNINSYQPPSSMTQSPAPLNYRLSLPDLQQEEQLQNQQLPIRQSAMTPTRTNAIRRPPPPIPPAKPLRVVSQEQRERENSIRNSRMPSADSIPQHVESNHAHHGSVPAHIGGQPLSRQTLQALSAVPRSRFISNDMWMQTKKKPDTQRNGGRESTYNYQHWLIQEAEHRRITEQQQRNAGSPKKQSPSHVHPPHAQPTWSTTPQPQPRQDKPLPDAIIQTLTQRVQNRVGLHDSKNSASSRRRHEDISCRDSQPQIPPSGHVPSNSSPPKSNATGNNGDSQEKMLSVSGKKKCSHCGEELGRGAAMIIESLRLFYHIDCFKCCVCHVQLGDGLMGTDVRVRNNKLHCHNCYSSDDGVKFSCV